MKKHILYIDPQSYNNLALYDFNLLNNIQNFEITFFANKKYNQELPKNCRIRKIFNYSNYTNKYFKLTSYLLSVIHLILYVLFNKIDLVHIQWIKVWFIDYIFACICKMMKINIVFTAHNLLPHDSGFKYYKSYLKFYHKVDKIIVHTDSSKKELIELFHIDAAKIAIIPHGMLSYKLSNANISLKIEKLKKQYSINNDDIIFSCLGIQNQYKGTDIVLKTWEIISELNTNPKYKLLIVGKNNGNIDYSLTQKIKNIIVIDEYVDDEVFHAFLKISSVVLLPYRKISQSGLLFTALEMNKPVLVSNIGGLTDPLSHAKVGWCMGEANIENLSRSLNFLLKNPNEFYEISHNLNNFEKIRNIYSWQNIGKKTSYLYNNIII